MFLIVCSLNVFAQPVWGYAPSDDLWDENMEVQVIGDLGYILTPTEFAVKNFETGSLQNLTPPPFSFTEFTREFVYSFAHNGLLYFGYRDNLVSTFSRYNPATDEWTSLNAPATDEGLLNANWTMSTSDDQYFYVGVPGLSFECSRYSIATGVWQSLALNIINVSNAVLAIYVQNGDIIVCTSLFEVFRYDATGWTLVQDFTGSYSGTSYEVFVHNDTLYSLQSNYTYIRDVNSDFSYNANSGFSTNAYNGYWIRNNIIYANQNGITRQLSVACQAVGDISESISGQYYNGSIVTPSAPFVGTGATTANFTYTWTNESNEIVAGNYQIPNYDDDNVVQLYVTASNGFCNYDDTATFNLQPGAWNTRGALPAAAYSRSHAVAFALNDYLYFGLGENSLGKLKDFYRYDYSTGLATRIADFPGTARSNCAYGENNGKGYIVGGRLGIVNSNEFWEFDPATETWQQLTNLPQPAYQQGVYFMLNNSFYVGRGISNSEEYYRYDFALNTWIEAPNESPTLFFSYQNYLSFAWNGSGYTINLGVIRKFNPTTQIWSTVSATIPSDLTGYGRWAIPMEDCVMIGGIESSPSKTYLFYPDQGVFKPGPSCNGFELQRFKAAVCKRNDELYLIAGEINNTLDTSPGTVQGEQEKYGRVISVFSANNCNTGSAFIPNYSDLVVNSNYFSGYNYNVPEEPEQTVRIGSIVYDFPEDELVVYETGDVLVEKYATYNGCVDTFSVMVNVGCQIQDDSLDRFDGTGRYFPMMWASGGKYYIGGGYRSACNSGANFWSYDPTTDVWTVLAPIPGGCRHYAATFTIGDKLYFNGGKADDEPWNLGDTYFSGTFEYDIASNIWTQKASHPNGNMFGHIAWVYQDKAYMVCGILSSVLGTAQKKFYEYNPANDQWTQLQDYPASLGIMNGTSVVTGDVAYVLGGYQKDPNETFPAYNDNNFYTYTYNHTTSSWSLLCPGTEGVVNSNGASSYYNSPQFASMHGGDIYLFNFYSVYKLNLTTNTWSPYGTIANACDEYNIDPSYDCGPVQAAVQVGDETILFTRSRSISEVNINVNFNFLRKFSVPSGDCGIPLPVAASIESTSNQLCDGQTLVLSSATQQAGWNYSWTLNDVLIADEISATLEVDEPGSYVLTVSDGNDVDVSNPFVVTTLSGPTFTIADSTTVNLCGGAIDLAGIASGEGFNYAWQYNGAPSGQSSATWQGVSEAGEYQLIATSGSCAFESPVWNVISTACGCFGDLDNDGFVDEQDLELLLSNFGCVGDCDYDLDDNGLVGAVDVGIFLGAAFGACPE